MVNLLCVKAFVILVCVFFVAGISCPFFVATEWNLNKVIADAARYYGLEDGEYSVRFIGSTLNASSEAETGVQAVTVDDVGRGVYTVSIRRSVSRPQTIATIFHEFAHAAQDKYGMDTGENAERHAEIMAFDAMTHTKYWWDGTHMLFTHSLKIKPADYRAPRTLWHAFLCGSNVSGFDGF